MKQLRFLLPAVISAFICSTALSDTFFVSNTGSNTNAGTTEATAVLTIEEAVSRILPFTEGTIILVDDANGEVFSGAANTDVPMGGRRVHLRSKSLTPTTCTIDGGDSFRGLQFTAPDDNGSTIEGITFSNLKDTSLGGGGALKIGFSSTQQVTITVSNCVFKSNEAANGNGGAVLLVNSGSTFTNCTFMENVVTGTSVKGGAVYAEISNPLFTECCFTENGNLTAVSLGGALASDVQVSLENCRFFGNEATMGGAVYSQGTLVMIGTSFAGNHASGVTNGGGAIALASSFVLMTNCTLAGNSSVGSGASIFVDSSSGGALSNSILWSNGGSDGVYEDGSNLVSFQCCQLQRVTLPSGDNDNVDPNFVATPGGWPSTIYGDLQLDDGSPCIDTGDDFSYSAGVILLTVDLNGTPRPLGEHVDRGAYEKVDAVFLINQVKQTIDGFVSDGTSLPANGHPLKQKLDKAAAAVVAGNIPLAIQRLNEFIVMVQSFTAPKKLTTLQAQELTNMAQAVIGLLQGP